MLPSANVSRSLLVGLNVVNLQPSSWVPSDAPVERFASARRANVACVDDGDRASVLKCRRIALEKGRAEGNED